MDISGKGKASERYERMSCKMIVAKMPNKESGGESLESEFTHGKVNLTFLCNEINITVSPGLGESKHIIQL